MIRTSFSAMGTTVDVFSASEAGLDTTRALFEDLEARFSRFLPSSELSRINETDDTMIQVSESIGSLLVTAQKLALATDGLVDPAVGSAVNRWGYDRTIEEVRDLDSAPTQQAIGSWFIEGHTLTREKGVAFDLGGIAKGWAADLAVESGMALLVSAGGDVRSAIDAATVEIVDPWGDSPAVVALGSGALATSSVTGRRWRAGSQAAHHIIDPRTAAPADTPVLSASALAATAAQAEAAAKSLILLGEEALVWAEAQPWVEGAIVAWCDGNVYGTHGLELAA